MRFRSERSKQLSVSQNKGHPLDQCVAFRKIFDVKKALAPLEQWIKDNLIRLPEVEFLLSALDLKFQDTIRFTE